MLSMTSSLLRWFSPFFHTKNARYAKKNLKGGRGYTHSVSESSETFHMNFLQKKVLYSRTLSEHKHTLTLTLLSVAHIFEYTAFCENFIRERGFKGKMRKFWASKISRYTVLGKFKNTISYFILIYKGKTKRTGKENDKDITIKNLRRQLGTVRREKRRLEEDIGLLRRTRYLENMDKRRARMKISRTIFSR